MFRMRPFAASHWSFQKWFQLQDKMRSIAAQQRQCNTWHHLIPNCQDKGCAHLISPFAAPAALTFPAEGLWAASSFGSRRVIQVKSRLIHGGPRRMDWKMIPDLTETWLGILSQPLSFGWVAFLFSISFGFLNSHLLVPIVLNWSNLY